MNKIIQKITICAVLTTALIAQPAEAMNRKPNWLRIGMVGVGILGAGYLAYKYLTEPSTKQIDDIKKDLETTETNLKNIEQRSKQERIEEEKKNKIFNDYDELIRIKNEELLQQEKKRKKIEKQRRKEKNRYYVTNKKTLLDDLVFYVNLCTNKDELIESMEYFTKLLNTEDLADLINTPIKMNLEEVSIFLYAKTPEIANVLVRYGGKNPLEITDITVLQFNNTDDTGYLSTKTGTDLYNIWCKTKYSQQPTKKEFNTILGYTCDQTFTKYCTLDNKIISFMINGFDVLSKYEQKYTVEVMSTSPYYAKKLVESMFNKDEFEKNTKFCIENDMSNMDTAKKKKAEDFAIFKFSVMVSQKKAKF